MEGESLLADSVCWTVKVVWCMDSGKCLVVLGSCLVDGGSWLGGRWKLASVNLLLLTNNNI